jgi:L-amino acid N-acyltransferase YncA
MAAVIGDGADHGLIRLHKRRGSKKCGPIPAAGFRFGPLVDCILKERPPDPGDSRLPD